MPNTATRLITLIMLLQRQSNQKAPDLAQQLGVSVRTLHRYVDLLDELGIPVYSERGPHGGFSLVRGFKIPPLVFTPEEAVAVYLGTGLVEEVWGKLYRDAAHGALAKLDNVLPDEQRHEVGWARRTLIATGMHRSEQEPLAPHLDALRRAAHARRRVSLVYRSLSRQETTRRKVDPFAIVHRSGWWYAVGYCHLRKGVRSFRVDRLVESVVLDEAFEPPADFDIHAYLAAEPHAEPQVTARLRFLPQWAMLARDWRPYWDSFEEQPDGSVIVTFSVPDMKWAAGRVLSYGPSAVVLGPPELHALVTEWARALAEFYTPDATE